VEWRGVYSLRFVDLTRHFGYTCSGEVTMKNPQRRADVPPGTKVKVVQKQHQRTGQLTEGVVQQILTNSPQHPHGIKVRLTSGIVGRVKAIVEERVIRE
jgi:uncharacterized repeat protein (TIGR03833 family)